MKTAYVIKCNKKLHCNWSSTRESKKALFCYNSFVELLLNDLVLKTNFICIRSYKCLKKQEASQATKTKILPSSLWTLSRDEFQDGLKPRRIEI